MLDDILKFLQTGPEEIEPPKQEKPQVILSADILKEIRFMKPAQLHALFRGKNVYLENTAQAYNVVKLMSEDKLNAIFGTGDD